MAPRQRTAPDRQFGSARQASAATETWGRPMSPVHATRRLGIGDHGTQEQGTRVDVSHGTHASL